MDIEVTSGFSRHPEKPLDAASAIQVITSKGHLAVRGRLQHPGGLAVWRTKLDVAQHKTPTRLEHQRAAGLTPTSPLYKLLVLMDGRTVYTPLFSGVFWHVQDYLLEDLDRIEVISGPGGTLWGANAVNGVINITTKSAKDTQGRICGSGRRRPGLQDFVARALWQAACCAPDVYFRVYASLCFRTVKYFPPARTPRQLEHGARRISDRCSQLLVRIR